MSTVLTGNAMAKGRRKGRDTADVARWDPLPRSWDPAPISPSAIRSYPLIEVEDRREWHPDPVAPLRSPRRWRHRLTLPQVVISPARPARFGVSATKTYSPTLPAFHAPKTLALCVRRKQRREVIFAKGKGGGKHRRPRRNKWSNYSCKG